MDEENKSKTQWAVLSLVYTSHRSFCLSVSWTETSLDCGNKKLAFWSRSFNFRSTELARVLGTRDQGDILKMGTVAKRFFRIFVFLAVVLRKIITGRLYQVPVVIW
jgi:hypothetical protein